MNKPALTFADMCWSLTAPTLVATIELRINKEYAIERRVHDEGDVYYVWTADELQAREEDGSLGRQPNDVLEVEAQQRWGITIIKRFDELRKHWDALNLLVSMDEQFS
jgi:hypothetical protein